MEGTPFGMLAAVHRPNGGRRAWNRQSFCPPSLWLPRSGGGDALAASDRYGQAVLVAADFTGDGVNDLIVSDPGDLGGVGSLYLFYGVDQGTPPPPADADAIVSLSAAGLADTGLRLKQACDLTGDSILDLWVEAHVVRSDGSVDTRILAVDPTNFSVLVDGQGGPGTPDYWDSLSADCDFTDNFILAMGGGPGSSGSSSGSPITDFVLQMPRIALEVFSPIPGVWGKNVADVLAISASARGLADHFLPMPPDATKQVKDRIDGERNALRHALWQGGLSFYFDPATAKAIGDAHEDGSIHPLDSWIDQYNNQVARNIFLNCLADGICTLEELIQEILRASNDRRLITKPCDPRVPQQLKDDAGIDCSGVFEGVPIGDVNSDGAVNTTDLAATVSACGTGLVTADLDASGAVDATDVQVLCGVLAGQG